MADKPDIAPIRVRQSIRLIKTCTQCGNSFQRDTRNTYAYWEKAKFCSSKCSAKSQSIAAQKKRGTIAEEFQRWFEIGEGCWEWNGARDRDGYGVFSYAGRMYRANRVALELHFGKLGNKYFACHHCDNPSCVRPSHLFAGTNQDNMRDMVAKGRHAKQKATRNG